MMMFAIQLYMPQKPLLLELVCMRISSEALSPDLSLAHLDLVTALQEALAPVEARLRADFQALRADMQGVREDLGKEARRSRRLAAIVRRQHFLLLVAHLNAYI